MFNKTMSRKNTDKRHSFLFYANRCFPHTRIHPAPPVQKTAAAFTKRRAAGYIPSGDWHTTSTGGKPPVNPSH